LKRFSDGKGTLVDIEYLADDSGRRVAAFGRPAGLAGSAVGLMVWCHQQINGNKTFPPLQASPNLDQLIGEVSKSLQQTKKQPKVMVIGAKGRCGQGAVHFLQAVGIKHITEWDMNETSRGGPFPEILGHDVFVNCIYLMGKSVPFITKDLILQDKNRELTVIVDVSCDYSNPENPLPIYHQLTTFLDPILNIDFIDHSTMKPLQLVSIDHLPSLIPKESSDNFARDFLPSLLHVKNWVNNESGPQVSVWQRSQKLFDEKLVEALDFLSKNPKT